VAGWNYFVVMISFPRIVPLLRINITDTSTSTDSTTTGILENALFLVHRITLMQIKGLAEKIGFLQSLVQNVHAAKNLFMVCKLVLKTVLRYYRVEK